MRMYPLVRLPGDGERDKREGDSGLLLAALTVLVLLGQIAHDGRWVTAPSTAAATSAAAMPFATPMAPTRPCTCFPAVSCKYLFYSVFQQLQVLIEKLSKSFDLLASRFDIKVRLP